MGRGWLRVNVFRSLNKSSGSNHATNRLSALQARIEAGHKSVAVYMFAQTVGVKPAKVRGAEDLLLSPVRGIAGDGDAAGGALNMAAWNMIRDLVSSEPSLNQAAWEGLRGVVGLLGSGDGSASDARARFRRAGKLEESTMLHACNGKICYIQIPATDIARSADFYHCVFGWNIGSAEMAPPLMMGWRSERRMGSGSSARYTARLLVYIHGR